MTQSILPDPMRTFHSACASFIVEGGQTGPEEGR
jgi:hypothetical protein